LLVLALGGCGRAIRDEGTRVTRLEHEILRAVYLSHEDEKLDSALLYRIEDRLYRACLPLNRHAFAKFYDDDPITAHSGWEKTLAIFDCKHEVDLICDKYPRFCAWRRTAPWLEW
jgi:hypothetical protein